MSLTFREKSGWFAHNLVRFPFVVLWFPFETLAGAFYILKTMATIDGSEALCFPWENREINFEVFINKQNK